MRYCITLLLACMFNAMAAQTKIAVLTDTHVMAKELLVKDGKAWQDYLASDRKLTDYSIPLFEKAIGLMKEEVKPDILVMTGDLSKDGEVVSHRYIAGKLAELKEAGIKVLVIPGNHDTGTADAKYYDGDDTRDAEVATKEVFASIYEEYGYSNTQREATTLTWCGEPIPGLVFIGIDSGVNGVLSATTLDWVCERAAEATAAGKQVIALMHYPLIPHFTGVEELVDYSVLKDYETVRNRMADAGIRVVLTGHVHTSDIAKDFNADLTKEIIDINTGSLVSYPCHYRVLTLSQDMQTLSVTTGGISELTAGDNFAETAKARLKSGVLEEVKAKGGVYALIATEVAEAYVIHAEGDEHQSEAAAAAITKFEQVAAMARALGLMSEEKLAEYVNMMNSMLRDISNYQVVGRENQTDDLTLQISLPLTPSAIRVIEDKRQVPDSNTYNLQGQKVTHGKGILIKNRKKICRLQK